MDYLTRAKYDHEALRMMLDVKKELMARLAKARGVNLLHLENVLRFWQEFFCREHLPAEEEFLFAALRRLDHPVLTELAVEHEDLYSYLETLAEIAEKLRAGKPNSGREFLETGKNFSMLLERHLNKENSIFAELTMQEADYRFTDFDKSMPSEELSRLTRLFSLLNDLAGEYLGREYKTTWLDVEERDEPDTNKEEAEDLISDVSKEEAEDLIPDGDKEETEDLRARALTPELPSGDTGSGEEGKPAEEQSEENEKEMTAGIKEEKEN